MTEPPMNQYGHMAPKCPNKVDVGLVIKLTPPPFLISAILNVDHIRLDPEEAISVVRADLIPEPSEDSQIIAMIQARSIWCEKSQV